MRILMLTQSYVPYVGGEELLQHHLSHELAARGHEVAVATLSRPGAPDFEEDRGVRVYRLRGTLQRLPWLYLNGEARWAPPAPEPGLALALRRVLARERPEIVHVHNWLGYSFLPLKAWSGARLVRSIHDYSVVCPKKTLMYGDLSGEAPCSGPELGKCLRCATSYYGALKSVPIVLGHRAMGPAERAAVDMFLPISRAVAAASGLVGSGLPYQVMPEFIADDVLTPRGDVTPWLAQLPREDFLLFVGGFRRVKGIEVLLRAYAELTAPPPLVIIGLSSSEPGSTTRFPSNVLVLKDWPNEAVLQAWRRASVALVPSLWPEPFGIVAIEAMAAGRPVIASGHGGLLDIVVPEQTGVLVPPGDSAALRGALDRLLADPALRERMGQAGQRRVREFQAASVVPRFEQVYAELLRGPGLGGRGSGARGQDPGRFADSSAGAALVAARDGAAPPAQRGGHQGRPYGGVSASSGVPAEPPVAPIRLLDVDLEQPLPDIRLSGPEAGRDYVGARVLLRLHAQPLGYLDLGADGGHRAAADYAPAIWAQFGPQIVEHLRQDGLEPPAGLDPAGLRLVGQPRCRIDRERARESAPAASVIVPTRERPDRLARCLEALARQDYPRFEVIVVDSPVTDATAELVRAGVPGLATLRYVRENGRGPARARNAGLRVATGDVVAFVDDDAVPDVHWLTELVRGFSAGANVACVTGLILPLELETPAQVWFEQFGGFSKGFTRRVYDLDRHRPADRLFPYTAARFGSGASMAFRRSVLLDLGGFDPLVGGEDADAYFRVISGGYQLVYQPTALVYHEHRREYEALRAQLFLYGRCLAAFLLKCVLDDPRRLVALVPKLPGGVWYALYPKSAKNRAKDATYPSELTALELKGMALGGWSYLRARWRARPDRPIEGAPARITDGASDGVPDGVPNGIPQGTSQSPQSAVCKRVG